MSTISNTHNVVVYESGKSKAFAGQRLSKHSWKTDKETKVKKDSKCVSIPVLSTEDITAHIPAIIPMIRGYLESVQDKMIKEKLEANHSLSVVSDSEISIAAMIAYTSEDGESSRLTKEVVAKWFEENIEESLALVLSDRLGVSDTPTEAESEQVFKIVGEFKNKVASLAGGKTSYSPELARSVRKAVDLAPEGDVIKERFIARLDKMMEVSAVNLLDLL